MSYLFHEKETCNPDISEWDVSQVSNYVSKLCSKTFQPSLFKAWTIKSHIVDALSNPHKHDDVIHLWDNYTSTYSWLTFVLLCNSLHKQKAMFWGASAFNHDIGSWNVSSGEDFVSIGTENVCITMDYVLQLSHQVTHDFLL